MIRDPSDGSVKTHNDQILEKMRGIPASTGPANDPSEGRPANVIDPTTSGLQTGSEKPENLARLEKSRAWLKEYREKNPGTSK